jgi:predicted RNA-binding protein (virulence factor B family)
LNNKKVRYLEDDVTFINTEIMQSITNGHAGGIFVYMCSFPDNFIFWKEDVRKHFNISRNKLDNAIKYLLEKGYIEEQNSGFIHLKLMID